MKNCKKCGETFLPKKGFKEYCSVLCKQARSRSAEVKEKISKSIAKKWAEDETYKSSLKLAKEKSIESLKIYWEEKLLTDSFSEMSFERKRRRVLIEQDFKCNICKISEWNSRPISLEIDHIDGNNNNNLRGNLEGLCPNCHSQTSTFRARNKRNASKVSDKDLVEALKKAKTIKEALENCGLTGKGNNYKRAKNLLQTINISPPPVA